MTEGSTEMGDNQPHPKLVKHYHEPGDFHELTFSCYRRMKFLVYPSRPEADAEGVSRFLGHVKWPCSVQVKEDLVTARSRLLDRLTIRERPGRRVLRFRRKGPGFERNLNTPAGVTLLDTSDGKRALAKRRSASGTPSATILGQCHPAGSGCTRPAM